MTACKKNILYAVLVALVMGIPSVWALDPSDVPAGSEAGVTEGRIREEANGKLLQEEPLQEVEVDVEKPVQPEMKEVALVVQKIRLRGEEVIPFQEFDSFFSQFEGKEMTFSDLNRVSHAVEQEFRRRGYFAAVFLPPQKIEGGIVDLEVVVSKMGELLVEGQKYFREAKIRSYWGIEPGEVISYNDIRTSILRLNQNPDRQVRPLLKAGAVPKTTDVHLMVKDSLPLHATYTFDNKGVKLTGKKRNGFMLRHNNAMLLDDTFIIGTTFGKDFGALYLQHRIPITGFGTTATWGFTHAQVNPKKEFERFGINGLSQSYTMSLRQSLTMSPQFASEVYAGLDIKEKRTRALSVTTAWDRLRVFSLGGRFQSQGRTGMWTGSQDFFFGVSPHGDGFPLTSRNAETSFFKYEFSLSRTQFLPWGIRGVATFRGQLAHDKLVPQEQMFFGGSSSVRGYPEGDYGAEKGLLVNLEYIVPPYFIPKDLYLPYDKKPFYDRLRLIGFFDYGYGRLIGPSATESRSRNMMGVGGGFSVSLLEHLSSRFEWGVNLNDEPLSESGHSQFHFTLNADI